MTAHANIVRPAPTAADHAFGLLVDMRIAIIDGAAQGALLAQAFMAGLGMAQAHQPTEASGRATRAAAHRVGLPTRGSVGKLTATERDRFLAKQRAEVLGLTGPTHAARKQVSDFDAHAARVMSDFFAKHGHPGRNV